MATLRIVSRRFEMSEGGDSIAEGIGGIRGVLRQ